MMNSLFRKYWGLTVVALLCCAPVAFGQQTLTLTSGVYSNPSMDGVYTGAYPFTSTVSGLPSTISAVCDDFNDEIYVGETWQVTVTALSSLSNSVSSGGVLFGGGSDPTYAPLGQLQLYEEAAWLTNAMLTNPGTYSTSDYSFAIWELMSPSATAYTALGSTEQGKVTALLNLAESSYASGGYGNYEILTPINGTQPSGDGRPQEFLVKTPESSSAVLLGADILGVLALAFVFRRRLTVPIS
jgi:hypothetical protein